MKAHPHSVLVVTLDSCRLDTARAASTPNLDAVAPLIAAQAAASFTLPAHVALFAGVPPGVPGLGIPWLDPKAGKVFKLVNHRIAAGSGDWLLLNGSDIVEGFRLAGWPTFGTGAVDWFDATTAPGRVLSRSFERFWYAGGPNAEAQVSWLLDEIARAEGACFAFLNVAETHVPYVHAGAAWDAAWNPCMPFGERNDAQECRRRQLACLTWLDGVIAPLLDCFEDATTLVCADHGDAWGEERQAPASSPSGSRHASAIVGGHPTSFPRHVVAGALRTMSVPSKQRGQRAERRPGLHEGFEVDHAVGLRVCRRSVAAHPPCRTTGGADRPSLHTPFPGSRIWIRERSADLGQRGAQGAFVRGREGIVGGLGDPAGDGLL